MKTILLLIALIFSLNFFQACSSVPVTIKQSVTVCDSLYIPEFNYYKHYCETFDVTIDNNGVQIKTRNP